jgi:hypothetical protein
MTVHVSADDVHFVWVGGANLRAVHLVARAVRGDLRVQGSKRGVGLRIQIGGRRWAVALARPGHAAEPGATNESVGRDLGLSRETIRLWAKRLAAEADPEVRRAREEHAELVALRRRLRVLEEEQEILAKAAAFRVRETGRTS